MLKKIGYIIIALLFGTLGIHNFLEKNWISGAAKLIISICSLFLFSGYFYYIISGLISIWILIDILQYCFTGNSYNFKKKIKI